MRVNLYAQNRHTLIIDGFPITGFAEGDFMTVKMEGNSANRTKGGDGPAMNIATGQGGVISISLLPTSPYLGDLYAIREQQKNNPRLFSIVLMTGVEEVITAAGCAFGELPQFQSGGPSMQGRQFDIECLKIDLDQSAVESIEGGLIGGLI